LKHLLRIAAVAALALPLAAVGHAQPAPLYTLTQSIPLPGGVKWDYLHFDAPTARLYISRGSEIAVVNTSTDQLVGTLGRLPGSHGIAVDPATGLIYADSATNRQAVAFNPQTFKPVATAPVVLDADGMAYDAPSKQIYVAGGDGNAVTPISTVTRKPAADIPLGGAPEFLASDGAGSLYVNINDKDEIIRIDTAKNTITARWPTAPCQSPTGLAIDPATRRLFSSCHSGVAVVLDADTGRLVATLPIGKGTDAAAFDPARKRFFSSDSDGTLTVVAENSADDFSVLGNVKTALGARTMAADPATGRIFLVTGTVTKTIPPKAPNDHPHYTFAPGSVKLLIFSPVN
jgi:DNA-binding beta-propeller fold protein YncE